MSKKYYAQIQTNKEVSLRINLTIDVKEEDIVRSILFKEDTIREGSLVGDDRHLSRYSLYEIFKLHGVPDLICILPPERSSYTIILVYTDVKMIIELAGTATTKSDGGYLICPGLGDGDISYMRIGLASPTDPMDIKTILGYPFYDSTPTIEEYMGMSREEFYQLIIGESQPACFEVD